MESKLLKILEKNLSFDDEIEFKDQYILCFEEIKNNSNYDFKNALFNFLFEKVKKPPINYTNILDNKNFN